MARFLSAIAYLAILILAVPAVQACMAPIDDSTPAAPPAALALDISPTAAIVEPTIAPPLAPTAPPVTVWGWWSPWGAEVEVPTASITGWLHTCPTYPGIVETLLADGARVWLPVESSGAAADVVAQLPPAGGVCEVR
jgi:hypothetical protein